MFDPDFIGILVSRRRGKKGKATEQGKEEPKIAGYFLHYAPELLLLLTVNHVWIRESII